MFLKKNMNNNCATQGSTTRLEHTSSNIELSSSVKSNDVTSFSSTSGTSSASSASSNISKTIRLKHQNAMKKINAIITHKICSIFEEKKCSSIEENRAIVVATHASKICEIKRGTTQ